jgi:hypothetical protein
VTVAALYVQTNGVYFGLDDVDPWDEARDARLYDGPWPVVAHPPCQRWCLLAPLVESLHAHYKVGDDGGTFAAALEAVRRFGGVLEHPAYSYAWPKHDLTEPYRGAWQATFCGGWVTEISQSAYGHEARKRTWLYYVGDNPPAMDWRDLPGVAQVSSFRSRRDDEDLGWNERHLDHGRSSYTPAALQTVLLDMARSAALVTA